jgi:acetyl-CoA C-acetyltransferase
MIDPTAAVLVGWHSLSRRDGDPRDALEAADLMASAARSALPAEPKSSVPADIDWIGTTEGLTRYADPGRLVAERIGAHRARTVLAKIGVMQQTLIAAACRTVQSGESTLALVVGGEAHYRHVRAAAAGLTAHVTRQPANLTPDEVLSSKGFDDNMAHPAETAAGLAATPGYYALIDSHWRASRGRGLDEHRDAIARLYERFARIASDNPGAARRERFDADAIRNPGPDNPMIAFPYTKLMTTTWTVDQACALLFTTAAHAEAMGVPRARWRYPVIAAESNHVVPVVARTRLAQPASLRIMADAIRRRTGIDTADMHLVDLYTAFPISVLVAAEELGIGPRTDLTLTGGMSFAGGPLNSYVFHAVAEAADRLADRRTGLALISGVSGYYSKQGLLIVGSAPPAERFAVVDVTAEVAHAEPAIPVVEVPEGTGRVVAATVLFAGGRPERGVVVVDLNDGQRAVARSHDAGTMTSIMTTDLVGRNVNVDNGVFEVVPD